MAEAKEPSSEIGQCPVARIPWLPAKKSKLKPEDHKFFKQMISSGEEGTRRLEFYRILTQTFPFFLPKRYHAMDCLALQTNSSCGQYWANALHLLHTYQTFGYSFHNDVRLMLESETPSLKYFRPALHLKLTPPLLKKDAEVCESAAEFLLEPWVLLQLPFQPLLLHQWSVALLAESLRFQAELFPFYSIPNRLQRPVNKLFEMCKVMYKKAMHCFNHFAIYMYEGVDCYGDTVSASFLDSLPETLAALEFVLSKECGNVVKALKRMAWNNSTKKDNKEIVKSASFDIEEIYFCYNMEYWKERSAISCWCPRNPSRNESVEILDKYSKESATAAEMAGLQKLVEEKLIDTGRLKGESKEVIFRALWRCPVPCIALYRAYVAASETCSEAVGIQEQDHGVMFDIFRLTSDVKMTDYLWRLTLVIQHTLKADRTRVPKIYVEAVNCEGPKMALSSVQDKLDSVKKGEKKWTHQNILKRVKSTCFSPSRQMCPDFKQGPEAIASHFQERIQNLVFKMIEKQYLTRRGSVRVIYPECQVAQYLLPCFVASFLDIYDDPTVTQENKKEYLKFVHNLVESYESREFHQNVEFRQVQWKEGKLPFSLVAHSIRCITQGLVVVRGRTVHHLQAVQNFLQTLLTGNKVLDVFDFKSNPHYSHCQWIFQMFMLASRMNKCVSTQLDTTYRGMVLFISYMLADMPTVDMDKNLRLVWRYHLDRIKKGRSSSFEAPAATLVRDFDALDFHQVYGLAVFWFFSTLDKAAFKEKLESAQGPGFPLDEIDAALWAFYSDDRWTLKQQIFSMAHIKGVEDRTLVTLAQARKNLFFEPVLKLLTEEGKVEMGKLGEITLFPVQHCRWCGLVDAPEFRKCPECAENGDYPDVNYFCSQECEKEALDKQHLEEHATFLVIKVGLSR